MRLFARLGRTLLVVLSATILHAQPIKWNNAPKTGFVFQITNNEAEKLLTKVNRDSTVKSLLHTEVATFHVDSGWTNRPGKGHFILARIIENKLHCEYTSVLPYQVLLLKEYNALSLQVLDLEGNVRDDAKVKLKRRRIPNDSESKTYRIDNAWVSSFIDHVTVELDGHRSVFNIEKHEVPSWSNDYYNNYDDGPDFYSYMITDKNKYKPGERVRFKSYALSGSRHPIRRDLEIWLIKPNKPLRVGTISPHRPGSFAGEIVLHDSLDLTLDKYYTLQLWEKSGRVVSNCSFKYEDYELQGNKLQVELETARHFYPASNHINITATNENGLPLKDARATVVVLTENIRETFQPLVVLPDTLMTKEIELDPETTTVVEIPPGLFQKSNTSYHVRVSVLNSQNQRMERGVSGSYSFSQYELTTTFSNDSIIYQVMSNGSLVQNVPVKVYRDGETEGMSMTLPHKEKINPAMTTIRFESELLSRSFRMMDMLPKIKFVGGIQKDSFNISIDNPQKIQVSWYIYRGSTLLEKGYGTSIDFKSKIIDRSQTYYAEVLYSYAGSDHIVSKEFEVREGKLDIALNLPDRIYPGQKVDALIEVTDDEGNPVGGVDLTAFATTAKLNYYVPDLPYYGRKSEPRSEQATYTRRNANKGNFVLDLDYDRWAKRVRLDTMKYYQFIYPGNKFFTHQFDIEDGTQFAAYVMKDGEAMQIYVVEVDRKPVYFSWTNHPKKYSFHVEPEKNKIITLRLHDRVLMLDSLCFDAGKKTIFSIDLDHLPEGVGTYKIAPVIARKRKYPKWVFTETEISRYKTYLSLFPRTTYPSYLQSGREFIAVSFSNESAHSITVGPVLPGELTYAEQGVYEIAYHHEGGYSYAFADNVVYKLHPSKLFPDKLTEVSFSPFATLNDVVMNKEMFLATTRYVAQKWYPRTIDLVDHSCRVKLLLPFGEVNSGVASVLFQDIKTNSVVSPCRSYNRTSDYFTIPRGYYHAIVLYNDGSYLKMDSINLQSYSNVVADMKSQRIHDADDASRGWLFNEPNNCFGSITPPTRTLTLTNSNYDNIGNVRGYLLDETNIPMPGAAIVVKGTTIGAVSDVNGFFSLDIPEDPSTLVISFIGYVPKEMEVTPGSEVSVMMEPDIQALQEVVVVGYEASSMRSLSYSVSTVLQGRAAGVSISKQKEELDNETNEKSVEEQSQYEQELYEELLTLKNIRSQFTDVGFWEPRLFTDRHGQSKFTVTFPDDITRWDAVVYGMNRRLQTGTLRKSIKSYKPLMAELHVPQFLVVGDSADFLGKVLNYTSDKTIHGKTKWSGSTTLEDELSFDSYHQEKIPVLVAPTDTLTTNYSFTRDDGYFDGEERKVPVIAQGTVRANGTLSVLKNNDELHLQSKKGSVVKVEILDNPIDLYTRDARYLLHYKYDCNEQLASKLIGLVNYKLIAQYKGEPFKYDNDVNKIIKRLLANQNDDFLWSWWDISSNTSYWMSAHILRALKLAKEAGYTVHLDLENIVRKATYKYEFLNEISISDVQIIHALATWNVKLDYAKYVKILDRKIQRYDSAEHDPMNRYAYPHYSLLNEKVLLLEVRQLQSLPFMSDVLMRYKRQTILNEAYFSDGLPIRYWHSGDLSVNATAYRIINRDSLLRDLALPMQMYFLSLRRKGDWNTYEASNVLMSILPDLIAQGSTYKIPASVSLSGKVNETIQKFPYKMELIDGQELHIKKESGMPLYCMQYIEERVTKAQSGTDAFKIKTEFNEKSLKAGNPTIMKATVEIKRDASLDHVMIEIPIPAGCSYADKRQFDHPIETHREYFKERTVIFCENMKAGTYVFQVQLLPRFTGKYHVNPAQVSLMYFPVINANTDMAKVKIEQ